MNIIKLLSRRGMGAFRVSGLSLETNVCSPTRSSALILLFLRLIRYASYLAHSCFFKYSTGCDVV